MPSRIFNVRLDANDAERVRALKKDGVELSAMVREAIRTEYNRRHPKPSWRSAKELMEQIFAEFPEPAGIEPHPRRSHRKALQRAFRQRLLDDHRRIVRTSLAKERKSKRRKAG